MEQHVKESKPGTLTRCIYDPGASVSAALTEAKVDANGVLISSSEDGYSPVAISFWAAKSNGKYKHFWRYLV